MDPILTEARQMMETVTPLRDDCGKLCGGACCHSLPGDETGMLLFPGEEALYLDRPDWRLRSTEHGMLAVCSGSCSRCDRPLSCRLFPLLPVVRGEEIRVAMDARAAAVCPLYAAGRSGLCADFVQAVRTCGTLLMRSPSQAAFLRQLTAIHDELKALRQTFGR